MNPQDDLRRKYTCTTNYKTVVPSNGLLINKEWKRSDVSREKDEKRLIIDRPPVKINNLTNHANHMTTGALSTTTQ